LVLSACLGKKQVYSSLFDMASASSWLSADKELMRFDILSHEGIWFQGRFAGLDTIHFKGFKKGDAYYCSLRLNPEDTAQFHPFKIFLQDHQFDTLIIRSNFSAPDVISDGRKFYRISK